LYYTNLESTESLLSSLSVDGSLVSNYVELNGLTQGTALSDGDYITLLYIEGRSAMSRDILMPLLETTVLRNVMKVVPTDNYGILHLIGDDKSLENTSTDGNVSSEGALLVNISSLNGSIGSLNSETDRAGETHRLLTSSSYHTLTGDKDGILRLVRLFVLIALFVFPGNTRHIIICNEWNPESCLEKEKFMREKYEFR
jgi:hypothetical protein